LAFTRTPSDASITPAVYTADVASELLLVDQAKDVAIDGSDKDDTILVTASALAADALNDYDVRGFEGNDEIVFDAALIQNSTINGNVGNDTLEVGSLFGLNSSLTGSLFLGGKGDDTVSGFAVSDGEINGNLGNDTVVVSNFGFATAGFNMYVGGGQGNDNVTVEGNFTNSIIDGNKGIDTINVLAGNHSGTSVNGGQGDDIIRSASDNTKGLRLDGNKGNDTIVSVGNLGSTVYGGQGSDTIVSASNQGEDSLIDAGTGADIVLTANGGVASTAVETVVFNQGDSVAATSSNLSTTPGAALTSGTITFGNKVDQLQSVGTTDKIDIDFTPGSFVELNGFANTTNLAPNGVFEVEGTFVNNVFTVVDTGAGAVGTSWLYIVGGENLTLGQVFTNSTNMFVSDTELATSNFV